MSTKHEAPSTEEIQEFIDQNSSFGFEMHVTKRFANLGFKCTHSRGYNDPASGRRREFDVVAEKKSGNCFVKFCVEATNISLPFVVHRRQRLIDESFHDILVIGENPSMPANGFEKKRIHVSANNYAVSILDNYGIYHSKEFVGKRVEQFKKNRSHGNPYVDSGSKDPHEKLEQAVSYAKWCLNELLRVHTPRGFHFIQPVVVVPNEMLYSVDFDESGDRKSDVVSVNRAAISDFHSVDVEGRAIVISHIEILTVDGIRPFVERILSDSTNCGETPAFRILGTGGTNWVNPQKAQS